MIFDAYQIPKLGLKELSALKINLYVYLPTKYAYIHMQTNIRTHTHKHRYYIYIPKYRMLLTL